MADFDFNKLSENEQDNLLRGHGKFVGACGHVISQCRCPGDPIVVPLSIRCSECDPSATLDDHYAAVREAREGFRKVALFGIGRKPNTESESQGIAVMDVPSFEKYVRSLGIEDIGAVKNRFEKVKSIDEIRKYIHSGQQDEDYGRLKYELGVVRTPNGDVIERGDPLQFRMQKPRAVENFYASLAKRGPSKLKPITSPTPGLHSLRVAAHLGELAACIKESSPGLSERLGSISVQASPVCRRQKQAAKVLRNLLGKLAGHRSYVLTIDRLASDLEHSRVTTKNDKALARLLMESEGTLADFKDEVKRMAEPDDRDSYKDKLIKRIYKAFLRDIKKHETDTPKEIMQTNRGADQLIGQISRSTEPAQKLISDIEKYERRFS